MREDLAQDAYKRCIAVYLIVQTQRFLLAEVMRQRGIDGGENAARHGDQVRRENHLYRGVCQA